MKFRLTLPAAAVLAGLAHAETPSFKDWLVGCDNTRACTALGLPHEDGAPVGYVRIDRSGDPAAPPAASAVLYSEGAEGAARMAVTIDGKSFGAFEARSDGAYVRVAFDAERSAQFVAAIANARSLTLQRTDTNEEKISVSLDGSSASLRYMDAQQKRDGGVTALVAKGGAPASAIPAPPAAPVIAAQTMTSPDALPARPAGLPKASEDCFNMPDEPIMFQTSGGAQIWGVCALAGAYNFSYDFYLLPKGGKLRPLPPQPGGAEVFGLTNPGLGEDGKTLSAFGKARGIGDCGESESWAWDGEALRQVSYVSMDACRGVSPDDWITTYRATVK